jgi:hypothetical protein
LSPQNVPLSFLFFFVLFYHCCKNFFADKFWGLNSLKLDTQVARPRSRLALTANKRVFLIFVGKARLSRSHFMNFVGKV